MKPTILLVILSLLLSAFAPLALADNNQPSSTDIGVTFSAGDFDWRRLVPYLLAASALPGEQGIKEMLENCRALRAYVTSQVRAQCSPDNNACAINGDSSTLDAEVNKRIAEIVEERILHRHKAAIVDYSLARQPFPFSEIAAVKDEKHPDAYLMLQFADHSYTAWEMQAKYGAPYDTNIFQWYSVFTYRLDGPSYTSKAVFEVDPVDGEVIKVALSLKRKKPKNVQ